ncbi:5'-nucleotidase C-terminal domain-containing protein [Flammeovirgaceae bacterium SG7u.111]|nr:5'-nucleotidase C-terminal domain-containing protein [Flammeovirgaceae bacterium SG7u.132]WPO38323.1 5'-nucleotidase C-terminal domain-containing protein [Flammeovirgaceae bacterium SG7u.111]
MIHRTKQTIFLLLPFLFLFACKDEPTPVGSKTGEKEQLTIFFLNDQHGQLNDFPKVKYLVEKERAAKNTLLVCAGDIFSGNPIVDQYSEKGFPMVDVMNKVGIDISVLGNHEFDYGIDVLKERMGQAEFEWVCANVDMLNSGVPQPNAFKTLEVGELKVTFLGLVETFGKDDDIIPSTHPWRVAQLSFERHYDIAGDFEQLKDEEDADLLIALTHLGSSSDISLAEDFPFFDAIIGGHSHEVIDRKINGIPVVQAGSYLSYLGKMELTIQDREIAETSVQFINLDTASSYDEPLAKVIADYNDAPEFDKVVGFANSHHSRNELGCFYTTALKEYFGTDISFQNGGGIRANIDEGDITALEIFNMDPFNNQGVVFTLTVGEIKEFFAQTGAGLHVSGISLERDERRVVIRDEAGKELSDDETLTIGINDYIPAVYDSYFSLEKAEIKEITTAEAIIQYLSNNPTVDYEGCSRYFDYDN